MSVLRPPYWLTLLLALDRWGAAVFFNRPDLTISTLCWMALTVEGIASGALPTAAEKMIALKMYNDVRPYHWQDWSLLCIGKCLEFIQPGHCSKARRDDLAVLNATRALLGGT